MTDAIDDGAMAEATVDAPDAPSENTFGKSRSPARQLKDLRSSAPGPDLFERRRKLWLSGRLYADQTPVPTSSNASSSEPLSNMARLELLLQRPGVEELDSTWRDAGLEVVWRMFNQGKILKEGMKLSVLVKILRASWIRDGTWPSTKTTNGRRALQALADDPFFDDPPDAPRAQSTADKQRNIG